MCGCYIPVRLSFALPCERAPLHLFCYTCRPVYCKPSPPANKPTACTGFLEVQRSLSIPTVYYAVTNETYYAGLSAPGSPLGVLASTDAESKKKIEIGARARRLADFSFSATVYAAHAPDFK
eukprot:412223-Pleurochrysis_carterae.AAC.1